MGANWSSSRLTTLIGVAAVAAATVTGAPAKAFPGSDGQVVGDRLAAGQELIPGQLLQSAGGQHQLQVDLEQGAVTLLGESCPEVTLGSSTAGSDQLRLRMQGDGNLVFYAGARPVFHTGTHGHPGAFLILQSDGNPVVYSPAGRPLWAGYPRCDSLVSAVGEIGLDPAAPVLRPGWALRSPRGTSQLIMQTDGNLVLYSAGRARWSSGTVGATGAYATLQSDGNLVIYRDGRAIWHNGARFAQLSAVDAHLYTGGSRLTVTDTGRLVLSQGLDKWNNDGTDTIRAVPWRQVWTA